MIFVDGILYDARGPSTLDPKGGETLVGLMNHPVLVSSSSAFNSIAEQKFSGPQGCKWVYVLQREYATVDPNLVDVAGTDEATTCVGLVIRNRRNGMTSIAHLDSPSIVEFGLIQMLTLVVDHDFDDILDVHLVGGFDDSSQLDNNHMQHRGYSIPLCAEIVEALEKSNRKFHLQTLHVLENNTRKDSEGNACPIFTGFLVDPSTGSVIPACFDGTSRCPDAIVRKTRLTASFEDPSWNGRLLETYDTQTDRFVIAPCKWTVRQLRIAMALQSLPDAEFLLTCSTSPSAEAPDFVENERRKLAYIIEHPDWRETFPLKQPRVFERISSGGWKRPTIVKKQVMNHTNNTEQFENDSGSEQKRRVLG